jgi:hypothetical protein
LDSIEFYYSNFSLTSSSKITTEVYKGDFKKCKDDDSEIFSKPFIIKLFYKDNILLKKKLIKGNLSEYEIYKLIKTLR